MIDSFEYNQACGIETIPRWSASPYLTEHQTSRSPITSTTSWTRRDGRGDSRPVSLTSSSRCCQRLQTHTAPPPAHRNHMWAAHCRTWSSGSCMSGKPLLLACDDTWLPCDVCAWLSWPPPPPPTTTRYDRTFVYVE